MIDSTSRGTFRRGLAPIFVEQLTRDALRPLMNAVRAEDLDLEVRQNYINVYYGRNSILKLEYQPLRDGFRASVHRKYNPPAGFIAKVDDDYAVQLFSLADAGGWAEGFVREIPRLCRDSALHNKPEGGAEFGLVRANRKPPFLVIDRQVQLGQVPDSRVDLLGLSIDENRTSVVLVELKHGKRLSAADALNQIDRYRGYYADGDSLRSVVADRFDTILTLKQELGLLHEVPPQPLRKLPIEFLVVLITAGLTVPIAPKAVDGPSRVYYVGCTMADLRIPKRACWQILRGA